MKKTFFLTPLLVMAFAFSGTAQSLDSLKQQTDRLNHITKELSVNALKAKQIMQIEDQYKSKAKALVKNDSLSETDKRRAFDKLIAEKNKQLKALLSEADFNKWVPTSEREAEQQTKQPDQNQK